MENIIEKIKEEENQIKDIVNQFPVEIKKVDIDWVFPNKWNPNQQADATYQALLRSLSSVGFIVPVLVREIGNEVYEIIDGEHKYRAAKEKGYTEILIASMGKIDDNLAMTLTVSLNNTRGQDDVLKRAELLKKIKEGQQSLFNLLPMSEKEIDENLKLLDFDFSQYENMQIKKEEKDEIAKVCDFIFKNENMLRRLHNDTENMKLKLLIEEFFAWRGTFCECVISRNQKLVK